MSKVFGIGWAKTGTTTLRDCLRTLGFVHHGQKMDLVPELREGDFRRTFEAVADYESFDDWPWIILYRELDQAFPGSRFVLTVRDERAWLKSYRNMLDREGPATQAQNENRSFLYGLCFPDVSDDALIERYRAHNAAVQSYFAGRDNALLVVNWEQGAGWSELCGFLNVDQPGCPFPHANRGQYKRKKFLGLF